MKEARLAKGLRAIIWCAVSTVAQTEPEHFSLPAQEKDALAVCEKYDWQVVEVMRVPGHSRSYRSLEKLAADALNSPLKIDAFYRLMDHLDKCDFDVIIVRDANRFARKASLLHYIVESVVEDCDAFVYSLNDGIVDARNADMWAAMKGYSSSREVKWLMEAFQRGADDRMERGLTSASYIPFTHKRIRNPHTGVDERIEVNEELRPLWNDLATLILEGVGWTVMGDELYRRFGHVDATGKPYWNHILWRICQHPMTWGHMGRRYFNKLGNWVFDETLPVPEGVKIKRNVIPALWTGELAEQIKNEMRRRHELRGSSRPHNTFKFSRLAICGECGATLGTYNYRGVRRGLRCSGSSNVHSRSPGRCKQRRVLNDHLIEVIDTILDDLLANKTPELFRQTTDHGANAEGQLRSVETEIGDLINAANALINEQATAPEIMKDLYRQRIRDMGERLEILKSNQTRLMTQAKKEKRDYLQSHTALESVRNMPRDEFWSLEDIQINQILRAILGKRKLVILNEKAIATVEK